MSDHDFPLTTPLSAIEARILGALIEKQLTTPEAYPLTLNALQLACNQSTSRTPVMNLTPAEILSALRTLEEQQLVHLQMGKRADRWEQRLEQQLNLTPTQTSLLSLLLLRGEQTAAELFTRSSRMQAFDDLEQLRHTLERLNSRGLVIQLSKQSGQREERFQQMLTRQPEAAAVSTQTQHSEDKEQRIANLEERLLELEQRLARLESA